MSRQSQLRALMKDKQASQQRRISSPLVRYDSSGRPICKLCKCIIKDWVTHCKQKAHLLKLLKLKKAKEARTSASSLTPSIAPSNGVGSSRSSTSSHVVATAGDDVASPSSISVAAPSSSTTRKIVAVDDVDGGSKSDVSSKDPGGSFSSSSSVIVSDSVHYSVEAGLPVGFFDSPRGAVESSSSAPVHSRAQDGMDSPSSNGVGRGAASAKKRRKTRHVSNENDGGVKATSRVDDGGADDVDDDGPTDASALASMRRDARAELLLKDKLLDALRSKRAQRQRTTAPSASSTTMSNDESPESSSSDGEESSEDDFDHWKSKMI